MKCDWCMNDAVGQVEVEKARYGLVQGVDRETGKRATARVITRHAITANACARCARRVSEQPQSMGPRKPKPDASQTTIFDMGA